VLLVVVLAPEGPELSDLESPEVLDREPEALELAGVTALKMLAMMASS